jgi:major membrane immunogen (membrane-anchored lipoprotein)
MWALGVALVILAAPLLAGCGRKTVGKSGTAEDRRQQAMKQKDEMAAIGKGKMEAAGKKTGP